jgi:alcohol dehydrogenase
VDTAKLKPRQRILIHAGSGGIGTFAIQLAKHIGAEVWTTTSGKNLEFVKNLGADHAINYQNEDFEKRVNNVDVVFDTLGGTSLDKSFSITLRNGWVVSIAGSPDFRTAKEMDLDIMRSLLLRVVGLRVNAKARRAGVNYRFIFMKSLSEELAQIATLVAKGVIKPVVDRIVPISDCQSAIEYSASGRARGKVIIAVID